MRSTRSVVAFVLAASASVPATALAQTELGGQVRPRMENRTGIGSPFVSMRTRVHLDHDAPWGAAFVQIQDVRLWGEELSTLEADADMIDVHQAWLQIGDGSLWLRAGRQEIALGGERLVGAVNWLQQGRTFDALRARLPLGPAAFDFVAARLFEDDAFPPTAPVDVDLFGVYASVPMEHAAAEAYVLADGGDETRWTFGSRILGTTAGFTWRGEGSLQRGATATTDRAAWMAGARVGRPLGPVGVTLWYDYLSGDDDPTDGELRVFDTLFGTNHKFYGYYDLFTNIPLHTAGRGLQDIALILDHDAGFATFSLAGHRFDATATDGIPSGRFGEEIDLTAVRVLGAGLTLTGGASWVNVGPALELLRGFDREALWFGYLMLDARF